jgi:hypothetical protein
MLRHIGNRRYKEEGKVKAYLQFWNDRGGKAELDGHEIDIPEGATTLTVQARGCCNSPPARHIAIPRPKRLVKKWRWVVGFRHREPIFTSTHHANQEELYDKFGKIEWCTAIAETEIEEDA